MSRSASRLARHYNTLAAVFHHKCTLVHVNTQFIKHRGRAQSHGQCRAPRAARKSEINAAMAHLKVKEHRSWPWKPLQVLLRCHGCAPSPAR
jgi:hypothetical protein